MTQRPADHGITDAEFFAPYPPPDFSVVLKRSEINRSKRPGEVVAEVPRNWPPPGWERDEFPANGSPEAALKWFDFQEWVLQLNEQHAWIGHDEIIRDAYRLVTHFGRLGWRNPPQEPKGVESVHDALIELRAVRAALVGWSGAGESQTRGGRTATQRANEPIPPDAYLSSSDLAKQYGVDAEALRKRLDRWRKTNESGWREVTDRRPREPKFLYQVAAVLAVIRELQSSGGTSG